MEDSKLVKLVKQYDCIYNKNNMDFKSISKKRAAWQRIAHEMGVHEQDCVRRWTNLRERFTKENRRVSALANNGMTTPNLWPLYNELTFLKSHIVPRVNRQKWIFTAEGKEPQMDYRAESSMNGQEDANEYECFTEPYQFKSSASILSETDTLEEEVEVFIPNDTSQSSPTFKPEIQNESYHTQNANRDLYAALKMIKQDYGSLRSRHQNPAVQGFGQMIMETISGMSERKQAIAMQRVTELVMNIKLEPEA
ncbi:transcription factor Adf-1-like [Bactrocera neohumeralis]|uniref:transcription factor Adf-1-like n=1 Tax=Bactrocera neohumeralis TaxID=98809 RepID=UPI0021663765|nr:transcription factor Adf-1-like [Bactrocera neohumeralis]